MHPIREHVLVKLVPRESESELVVRVHERLTHDSKGRPYRDYFAGDAPDPTLWAEVVAVGPGRVTRKGVRVEPDVHPGQRVLIPNPSGSHLLVRGVPHVVLCEREILAVDASLPT